VSVWCRSHAAEMTRRKRSREDMQRQQGGRRLEYPSSMEEEAFTTWFPVVVQDEMNQGTDVFMDVQALLMLPSRNAKSCKSIYAYGNHIRVRSVESNMNTCDSGVATTFLQACRASNNSRNVRTSNLEYIGWVEEIIGIDCGEFELIVLYCTWVRANLRGVGVTMKRDDYGFTLIKFNRVIPYSADSFAFPLHVQQVFLWTMWRIPNGKLY
jgi:hypothetical protein